MCVLKSLIFTNPWPKRLRCQNPIDYVSPIAVLEFSLISSSPYKRTMRGEESGFFFLFFLALCEKIFYRSCLGFVKLGKIVSCRLERRAQEHDCSSASPRYSTCYNLFYYSRNKMELFSSWNHDFLTVSCLLYMLRFPYCLSYLISCMIALDLWWRVFFLQVYQELGATKWSNNRGAT